MNTLVDIENVRTLAGKHEKIPVRPLTILTGENSSGKTAFMACLSVLSDPIGFPLNPNFDLPPYSLGRYDTIASHRSGDSGPAKSFSLGWADTNSGFRVLATYENRGGAAVLKSFDSHSKYADINLLADRSAQKYEVTVSLARTAKTYQFSLVSSNLPLDDLITHSLVRLYPGEIDLESSYLGYQTLGAPNSLAPIRAKPDRTYDPGSEAFSPEGGHIPSLLEKLLGDANSAEQSNDIRHDLEQFGSESGLFRHMEVKSLGKKGSDPFQVLVNVGGRAVNLLDVGYGVSQALPVIVEGRFSPARTLLIQQPELHLHPKAQAALGTFFSRLASSILKGQAKREFVIETHSDYIVDRIRREVAQKTISRESVIILYFERNGLSTIVHPLELDDAGNILNAPPSYREFFVREELDLLTRV